MDKRIDMAQTDQTYTVPSDGVQIPGGIFIPGNIPFARDYGAVFQAQLNRIKTTLGDFAKQKGLEQAYVEAVRDGKAAPNAALLAAIEQSSPLSVRELVDPRYWHRVPVHDDSVGGVVVCHADKSSANYRVYHRSADPDSPEVKYYTYYHTAAQKKSTIIPEKIVEHFEWDPSDPELPDGYFNNGHRERQMTVTIGEVNYHWIDAQGKKHVVETHDGDANAISPFTRHSFTVPPEEEGYILAVTDLGAIGTDAFRALAHAHVADPEAYLALMKQVMPVDPSSSFDKLGGFMFRKYEDAPEETKGPYIIRKLMDGITFHRTFRALELDLRFDTSVYIWEDDDFLLDSSQHNWGYNHGGSPVRLEWDSGINQAVIEPGASFSIQKHIPHAFRNDGGLEGKVLIMQSNPVVENPFEQLALVHKFRGEAGLLRAASESEVWFQEVKKK